MPDSSSVNSFFDYYRGDYGLDKLDLGVRYSSKNQFINFIQNDQRADFFSIQNTNYCLLKIFDHYDRSKVIIVSLIDNLIKGAAGQAVQCFNLSHGFDESSALIK